MSHVLGLRASAVAVVIVMVSTVAEAQHAKFLFPLPKGGPYPGAPNAYDWIDRIGTEAIKKRGNLDELAEGFDPLSPDDKGLEPTYPTSPEVPSACNSFTEGFGSFGPPDPLPAAKPCRECGFQKALQDLQNTRYRLEKLRRVGIQTKTLVSNALAFGDSLAGAAGIGGLQWSVVERENIQKSYAQFKTAYDAKYAELMALLQKTLRQIGDCEELVFKQESWYQRYGHLYYEMMAVFYRRTE